MQKLERTFAQWAKARLSFILLMGNNQYKETVMPNFLDGNATGVNTALSGLRGFGLGIAVAIPLNIPAVAQASEQVPLPTDAEELMFTEARLHLDRISDSVDAMEIFVAWQDHLEQVALDDPEEALRQRLPVSACLTTIFAAISDDMPGLFAPEPEGDAVIITQ